MLKLIRFHTCLVFVASINAFALDEIDVNVYTSQITIFYPEVNLSINNNTDTEKSIIVRFFYDKFSVTKKDNESCKPYLRNSDESYRNFLVRKFYSEIGRDDKTGAVIPKKSFVHRVYVLGLNNISSSCSLLYEVTDRATGKIIKNGGVQLGSKIEIKNNQYDVKANDLDIDYIVEKVTGTHEQENNSNSDVDLLATVRVKNKTEDFFSLKFTEKKLVNCTKSSIQTSIIQGLDGSAMIVKPSLYAVGLTLLKLGVDENPKCSLVLKLQDVSASFEKNISIPLKSLGEYDSMRNPLIN